MEYYVCYEKDVCMLTAIHPLIYHYDEKEALSGEKHESMHVL